MPIIDVNAANKKALIMQDTWGHLYPEPGRKYQGHITVVTSSYGITTVFDTNFPDLQNSPQEYNLIHSILGRPEFKKTGIYSVSCTLWFYKTDCVCKRLYDSGKVIKVKVKKLNKLIQPYIYSKE